MSAVGPTGPAGPDPDRVVLRYGDSYAFRVIMAGTPFEFFAVPRRLDGTTGFLELDFIVEAEHYERLNAVT